MHQQLSESRTACEPCEIFFHIPKTGGQSLHNLISREYRRGLILNTHLGVLTPSVWQSFTRQLTVDPVQQRPRYRAVTGHMKFGVHELLNGPSRYITFLRDPVKRFISYYAMVRRMGLVPADHRLDPSRPDWNFEGCETVPRELDNGQTRALADVDWNLPLGQCTDEHLKTAQANLDNHFAFVGLTEHFDLSLMLLKRICGWRWHFYARKNVSPTRSPRLSPDLLDSIARLNCLDYQLYLYAKNRLMETARHHGGALRLEHAAYVACNTIHKGKHVIWHPLKQTLKRAGAPRQKPAGSRSALKNPAAGTL